MTNLIFIDLYEKTTAYEKVFIPDISCRLFTVFLIKKALNRKHHMAVETNRNKGTSGTEYT